MRQDVASGRSSAAPDPQCLERRAFSGRDRADNAYAREWLDQAFGFARASQMWRYTFGPGEFDFTDWIFAHALPFLTGATDGLDLIALWVLVACRSRGVMPCLDFAVPAGPAPVALDHTCHDCVVSNVSCRAENSHRVERVSWEVASLDELIMHWAISCRLTALTNSSGGLTAEGTHLVVACKHCRSLRHPGWGLVVQLASLAPKEEVQVMCLCGVGHAACLVIYCA